MKSGIATAVTGAVMAASFGAVSALAQDHNHVPGWANTHNHRYQRGDNSDWEAKTQLFNALGARSPAAQCTLQNLSEADGNVIVNKYRRQVRQTSEAAALGWAHEQVEMHHRRLKAQGKC